MANPKFIRELDPAAALAATDAMPIDQGANGLKVLLSALRTFFRIGTTTNDNAPAGSLGEFISAEVLAGAPVALVNATPATITSIALTAGDWDVEASFGYIINAATVVTALQGSISLTAATMDSTPAALGQLRYPAGSVPGGNIIFTSTRKRLSLAAPATVYLVENAFFTTNTCSGWGHISARRVR